MSSSHPYTSPYKITFENKTYRVTPHPNCMRIDIVGIFTKPVDSDLRHRLLLSGLIKCHPDFLNSIQYSEQHEYDTTPVVSQGYSWGEFFINYNHTCKLCKCRSMDCKYDCKVAGCPIARDLNDKKVTVEWIRKHNWLAK